MGVLAIQQGDARRREFRRWLAFSLLAHLGLAASLAWSPGFEMETPAGVISVDLVAAPAPAPPAPAARPAPAAPVRKKVVLPAEPQPLPEPKPKPVEKAKPVATPRPAPKPAEKPPERVEKDYADVLDQLRSEAGEPAPAPARTAARSPAGPPGMGGRGRPVSPEVAAWLRKAEVHVRRAWVMPPGFRLQPLVAVVVVELDASGRVVAEPRIEARSGNPWYDENVVRGIRKASPLPAPPAAGEWTFVFDAEESY